MVKHVILWQLKDELSAEEKAAVSGWVSFRKPNSISRSRAKRRSKSVAFLIV